MQIEHLPSQRQSQFSEVVFGKMSMDGIKILLDALQGEKYRGLKTVKNLIPGCSDYSGSPYH